MIYNEKALGRLLRDIGMEMPFGYLIKGEGAGMIYGPLPNRDKGYEAVAKAISTVLHSKEFKRNAKSGRVMKGGDRTIDEMLKRDLTKEEIGSFKMLYGIGCAKKGYKAISSETGMTTKDITRIENTVKTILRNGKGKRRPAKYRSRIWKLAYKKMKLKT